MSAIGSFNPKPAAFAGHKGQSFATDPAAEALRQKIIHFMTDATDNDPRSLQTALGPSDIGHPCSREIAYKAAGVRKNPSYLDPMPNILGKAFHTWMETVLPSDEWVPEQKVHVAHGLSGHSDAYHIPTRTVVDWKLLGRTQHQAWLGGYTKEQYRVQAHSYGLGFVNAGYPVDRVAVAVFCRARPLQDLYVWAETWDPTVAQQALNRLGRIRMYVAASGASDSNRSPLLQISPTSGDSCYFCEFKGNPVQGLCDKAK